VFVLVWETAVCLNGIKGKETGQIENETKLVQLNKLCESKLQCKMFTQQEASVWRGWRRGCYSVRRGMLYRDTECCGGK
jgi:hypothetical protein